MAYAMQVHIVYGYNDSFEEVSGDIFRESTHILEIVEEFAVWYILLHYIGDWNLISIALNHNSVLLVFVRLCDILMV